jgi:polysaccharide export outer membrane protein
MLDVSDVRRHLLSPNFHLPSPIYLLLALLCGITVAVAQTPPANNTPVAASAAVTNAPSVTPTTLSGYVPDDKYKLRTGDKISLQIIEDRDLPKSLLVTDSGEVDVPYVGRVAAADKTCKQLANELKAQLEKEYYHRATVIIALDAANKLLGRIYVWGQVRNQGPIDISVNENLTAGRAILRAGGFGDFANKKRVKVVRGGAEGANKQSFELNMAEILEDGKTEKDLLLQPDDFIIVPSRLINF